MGFDSVDQTFGSGFQNQEHRSLPVNKGLLNTLWWSGLGMTAAIIGVGVFIFLLQSPDKPQNFTTKAVPFEPVSSEKIEQPSIPAETIPSPNHNEPVFDVPETLLQVPATPKFSTKKKEETESDPVFPVILPRTVRSPKVPSVRFVNILASLDMQDNNLLNNAFENMESNLFYAWDNRLSGYTYEVVLRPAYSNNSGAPCRTAILKSWKEPQSRNTVYKQQKISACRALQHPEWYIR